MQLLVHHPLARWYGLSLRLQSHELSEAVIKAKPTEAEKHTSHYQITAYDKQSSPHEHVYYNTVVLTYNEPQRTRKICSLYKMFIIKKCTYSLFEMYAHVL